MIKEQKKSHGGKHSPALPENLAGANREEEICSKFCSVYSDLYSLADTSYEMEVIKVPIEAKTSEHCTSEVVKITGSVVKLAAASMKKSKGDVSGSYMSDAIRKHQKIRYFPLLQWNKTRISVEPSTV